MGGSNARRRHTRPPGRAATHRGRDAFEQPWLLREHGGAPGWAIIATASVVIAVAAMGMGIQGL